MLRWKYFVQSEDDAFVKLIEAFTKATGVPVEISRETYEDVQPKASVAANTGTGPDLFWGLYSLPHLFPQKCLDVTDVADYLGKKYGGWVDSAIKYGKAPAPNGSIFRSAIGGGLINYRLEASKKAGFSKFPTRPANSSNTPRHEGARTHRAVSRSAMLPATAIPGCTGACGHITARSSTRTTR